MAPFVWKRGSGWGLLAVALLWPSTLLAEEAQADRAAPQFEQQPLFRSGSGGYHTYRIPAVVVSNEGTMLAFCEGRKNSRADHGDVDLVLRSSADHGRTWSEAAVVADGGEHTMGNPCAVVERRSGVIWLTYCRDNRKIFVVQSGDDGRSWSKPVDITRDVVDPAWHWFGTGPGHGVQLHGMQNHGGRLVIPCWADATPRLGEKQCSFVFYSDDAGATWKRGGALDADGSDECQVVELSDGGLYLNARSRQGKRQRAYAVSRDGGETWSPIRYHPQLPELSCQGSVVRLEAAGSKRGRLLVVAPASQTSRSQLTAWLSDDDGVTWPASKVIHAGQAGYSDAAVLDDGTIILLYEADNYSKIMCARFNAAWLSSSGAP